MQNTLKDKIQKAFNTFDGTNLETLDLFYAKEVVFQDPIRKVQGLVDLKDYYRHIYANVNSIHFNFNNFITNDAHSICAEWVMYLEIKVLGIIKKNQVEGCSIFKFNENGLVVSHRDYVDLGSMVYENIPMLGSLIKKIKQKL